MIKAAFRRVRLGRARKEDTRFVEQEAATYIGLLGHYMANGSQPLHISIHHDGWRGDNPKNYTTDPRRHGRMETQFVDLIEVTSAVRVRVTQVTLYIAARGSGGFRSMCCMNSLPTWSSPSGMAGIFRS